MTDEATLPGFTDYMYSCQLGSEVLHGQSTFRPLA